MDPTIAQGTTLDRYLLETLRDYRGATGAFVDLIQQMTLAGKMISSRVNRAGLAGMIGGTGEVNIQGEYVQVLDRYANATFAWAVEQRAHCCLLVSEEEELPRVLDPDGRYVVTVDPLDGSTNIDVNATIGTIFGIFRRKSAEGTPATADDALRCGRDLLAAGYIIYGSGTVMVVATEAGVHGFTLDPTVGEFFLSHQHIKTPKGAIYSINEGYDRQWQPGVKAWVEAMKDRGVGARYIGSLVADFHRNLLKGGVFVYPGTKKSPGGKLRLLYEAFPLAYIAEKAGGAATNGREPILDLVPTSLHQRVPLVIGSAEDVAEATRYLSADPV